jgi:Putative zinc-finger
MTDFPPPPGAFAPPVSDEAWELASAYLDNEVTPEERAQVEASPVLLSLVARLAPNREALLVAPVAADSMRDASIDQALQALDLDAAAPPAAAPVVSLDQARSQRTTKSNRWLAPLAAAAGIAVVVGLGATVLGRGGERKQSSSKEAATTVAPVAKPVAAATTAAPKAGAAQQTTSAAPATTTIATAPSADTTTAFVATTTAPTTTAPTTTAPTTTAPSPTASSAAPAATPTTSRPVQSDVAITKSEIDELRRLVNSAQTFAAEACSAPSEAPLAVATLLWRGEQSTLFTNEARTVVVVVFDATCGRSATASL